MKNIILTSISALTIGLTQAQVVNIPDANFKAALISQGVDVNNDKSIQISEALAVTSLDINRKSIADLTGIEAFLGLTNFNCGNNSITSIDLSKIAGLKVLYCYNNLLNTLDVSKNTSLSYLDCSSNSISVLNIKGANDLTQLYCDTNKLNELNVSQNINLTSLSCVSNPNLTQICLNSTQLGLVFTDPIQWNKDIGATWSASCSIVTLIEDERQKLSREPEKIYTIEGRPINLEEANSGVFIYQYRDGSTRKVMKIEQ